MLYIAVTKEGLRIMSVFDVAAYILANEGEMTAMKLQKLCYYAQAWSLVWDERPLFDERIEAWANGPVCPALYTAHRGRFTLNNGDIVGDPDNLDDEAIDTINAILDEYGDKDAHWLSALSHSEDPWINARSGISEGERGSRVITLGNMADYYGNL